MNSPWSDRLRLEVIGPDRGGDVIRRNAAPAIRIGSSHSRIAKVWPPRISADATPLTVDRIGCTTR